MDKDAPGARPDLGARQTLRRRVATELSWACSRAGARSIHPFLTMTLMGVIVTLVGVTIQGGVEYLAMKSCCVPPLSLPRCSLPQPASAQTASGRFAASRALRTCHRNPGCGASRGAEQASVHRDGGVTCRRQLAQRIDVGRCSARRLAQPDCGDTWRSAPRSCESSPRRSVAGWGCATSSAATIVATQQLLWPDILRRR